MCMIYDVKITKRLKERFKRNRGILRLWKVYKKEDNELISPCYHFNKDGIKSPGIYISSRKNKVNNCEVIRDGFHVFLNEKDAKDWLLFYSDIIVEVKVKGKDLVGGGYLTEENLLKTAVFMKLEITKEEWDKIKF